MQHCTWSDSLLQATKKQKGGKKREIRRVEKIKRFANGPGGPLSLGRLSNPPTELIDS